MTPSQRAHVLDRAVADGRILATRRAHYERLWDQDPVGTEQFVERLTAVPNLAGAAPGAPTPTPATPTGDDAYDQSWLSPAERAKIDAVRNGAPPPTVVQEP